MKYTNILMAVAVIIGLILIMMKVAYATLLLYFIPATLIVNFVRIWEKKKRMNDQHLFVKKQETIFIQKTDK